MTRVPLTTGQPSRHAFLERALYPLVAVVLVSMAAALMATYAIQLPLVQDEFSHHYQVAHLLEAVPYRDYVPPKTIVGFALLTPVLLVVEDVWMSLVSVKLELVMWIACWSLALASWIRRHYGQGAALISLLLLLTHTTFLERAGELRVDMLAATWGTAAVLAVASGRIITGALLTAASVLMTQKGVYFVVAAGLPLGLNALRRRRWDRALLFGAIIGGVSCCYFLVAWWLGGGERATFSVVTSARVIATQDLYSGMSRYWAQTLSRNPVHWGLSVVALLALAWTSRAAWGLGEGVMSRHPAHGGLQRNSFLSISTAALLALCIWHKQPWPYFLVFPLPLLATVVGATSTLLSGRLVRATSVAALLFAAGYGLLHRVPVALARSSAGQERVVRALLAMTETDGVYFSGILMLPSRRHTPGFDWLDEVKLAQLRQSPDAALERFKREPPRVVLQSYRINGLPEPLKQWIARNYISIGSNLLAHAPPISKTMSAVNLLGGGSYRVKGPAAARVVLQSGQVLTSGSVFQFPPGSSVLLEEGGARLVAFSRAPEVASVWEQPDIDLFYRVYSY